ncbi:MAG: glutamate--tRNA ligase [Gammaproteobacteria bacterium]
MMEKIQVRTRFAPSPTGYLHIGGARTALFSWLYARRHGGVFILRIEDTDLERSTQAAVDAILEGMAWLGLDHDEGPYFQTRRCDRYREIIDRLLREGQAYHCYCSKERLEALRAEQMGRKEKPRYDGYCRNAARTGSRPVVRFKNPADGEVAVHDLIRGQVVFHNRELDDLIIARADGTPTYNLTVVVDDMDMAISHVIRGDDHLNNTPRQINILRALGASIPAYAHVPMILGGDGQRLSKRHGAVSVLQFREDGYLPEALLNYLLRLGWSHGDQEIFLKQEMIDKFGTETINKAAAAFDSAKLQWLNQHYLKNIPTPELLAHLGWHLDRLGIAASDPPALGDVVQPLRERSKTLVEMAESAGIFYRDFSTYDEPAAEKYLTPLMADPLLMLRQRFSDLPRWTQEAVHEAITHVAARFELKLGQLAQPLRVALTGGSVSPPIDTTVWLMGRERSLRRITKAIAYVQSQGVVDTGAGLS